MPSASTNRPMSASTPIVSSLCSRTRPTSLSPTDRIFPRIMLPSLAMRKRTARSRDQPLVFGFGRTLAVLDSCTCSEREPELGAGCIALVRILGERAVDDRVDAFWKLGSDQAHRRV